MATFAPNATSTVDPTYGQRSVFGGDGFSTAPADADLDCEDEQEALAYLQLVKNEASKIPHVLVAPRPGPQAFPPGYAAAAAAAASPSMPPKKKRRRRRHWDEQDDGAEVQYAGGEVTVHADKRRRVSRQQNVAVELSYEDEGTETRALTYDDEENEAGVDYDNHNHIHEESEEDDRCSNDAHEPDYSLGHHNLYETDDGDPRGYYNDGAYVAVSIGEDSPADNRTLNNTNRQSSATCLLDNLDPDACREAAAAQFRSAYRTRLLLTHFADMRAIFLSSPDADPNALAAGIAALPPDHDTDVGPLSASSGVFRRWFYLLRTTDPMPAQIAAMDKVSVLRLLRILLRGLLTGGLASSRSSRAARFARGLAGGSGGGGNGGLHMTARTSRWLWALFARLPDRGELDYREVGYIRDVAKQAVMRLAHLSYDMSGTDGQDGVEDGGDETDPESGRQADDGEETALAGRIGTPTRREETADEDDFAADQDDLSMVQSEPGIGENEVRTEDPVTGKENEEDVEEESADDQDDEMQQRATLEMVLAVAGEFYGQRDLLAFRTPW
ncbi:hypothetical protein SEPCBS119000_000051 [Sporothrix epigloea]|uniref:Uncharacterized protein n=1 Tax=Sporothrix epigloea TaxID=1892477 RepID=A0ABP0D434_9PEZI